jgi:anti-sigma factor RsiW
VAAGTCPDPTEISSLVDGELGRRRAAEIEDHLASCDTCRRAAAETRAVKAILAHAPRIECSEELNRSLARALELAQRTRTTGFLVQMRKWAWMRVPMVYAVGICLAVIVVSAGASKLRQTGPQDDPFTPLVRAHIICESSQRVRPLEDVMCLPIKF